MRLVTELYGAGLERILTIVGKVDPPLVVDLAADDLVASLLLVHDLHPEDLEQRVEGALESVRPFLRHHDGDVELLDIDAAVGAVHLRLLGSCDGCPSSSVTLQLAVEKAITRPRRRSSSSTSRRTTPTSFPPVSPTGTARPVALGRKPVYDDVPVRGRRGGVGMSERGRARSPFSLASARRRVPGGRSRRRALRDLRRGDRRRPRPPRRSRRPCPAMRLSAAATCSSSPTAPAATGSEPCPTATCPSPDFRLSPEQWDSLQIPVSVAFFFVNSSLDRVAAFYPSPAGATESLLPLETWSDLVAANPELSTLAARRRGVPRPLRTRRQRARVLPGARRHLLRARRAAAHDWRGFDGGREALDALAAFFDRVRDRARPYEAAVP